MSCQAPLETAPHCLSGYGLDFKNLARLVLPFERDPLLVHDKDLAKEDKVGASTGNRTSELAKEVDQS